MLVRPSQKTLGHLCENVCTSVDNTIILVEDELNVVLSRLVGGFTNGKDGDTPVFLSLHEGAPITNSTLTRGAS